jgi:hypothetical protein
MTRLTKGVKPPSRSWYSWAKLLSMAARTSRPWRVAEAVQMVISDEASKASTPAETVLVWVTQSALR